MSDMKLRFTKMQGAGNDFVVLDATRDTLPLDVALLKRLGDRRLGVGADQILVVEPPSSKDVDFGYRIFNGATGEEVEHCGNGARCFVRYVREHGLIDRDVVRVQTMNNRLELRLQPDGRVTVDMNAPIFAPDRLPFDAAGLVPRAVGAFELWPLALADGGTVEVAGLDNAQGQRSGRQSFHLVDRAGDQGPVLGTISLPPGVQRSIQVRLIYPADATPPQVLSLLKATPAPSPEPAVKQSEPSPAARP